MLDICDVQDTCNGNGACINNLAQNTILCRPVASTGCDVPEYCTGTNIACPPDGFASAGTLCGSAAVDVCDLQDTCDASGNCINNLEPNTFVCRAADSTGCDVPEYCTGSSVTCPTNSFQLTGLIYFQLQQFESLFRQIFRITTCNFNL